MIRKLSSFFCCALLLSFVWLLQSSCTTPPPPQQPSIDYGPASLKRHQIVQTARNFQQHRPKTLQEMSDMLGAPPQGTYTDKNGKYCFWRAYEEISWKMQDGIAACLVNGDGRIKKCYISYSPRPFDHPEGMGNAINAGDVDLCDAAKHPGLLQALREPFQEVSRLRAAAYDNDVAFSPSGLNMTFLPRGAYVEKWVGATPIIHYPDSIHQAQAPQDDMTEAEAAGELYRTGRELFRAIRTLSGH